MQLRTFDFLMETGWQVAISTWQLPPLYRSGPRIAISESGNLGDFLWIFHYPRRQNSLFIGLSGVWGAKKRPTAVSTAPTALRSRGNCLTSQSGICKGFLLVSNRA